MSLSDDQKKRLLVIDEIARGQLLGAYTTQSDACCSLIVHRMVIAVLVNNPKRTEQDVQKEHAA